MKVKELVTVLDETDLFFVFVDGEEVPNERNKYQHESYGLEELKQFNDYSVELLQSGMCGGDPMLLHLISRTNQKKGSDLTS